MTYYNLIETIDIRPFIQEIIASTNNLYLSLPSIDNEIAQVLVNEITSRPNLIVNIVIDNSEESIRNGFGDIEGIEKLLQFKINISQSDGNLISFIISDELGYFIFPQSRIFIEKAQGTNAFRIDPITIQLLKKHFFNYENSITDSDVGSLGEKAGNHFKTVINELNMVKPSMSTVSPFDTGKHLENMQKLKINPPNPPDLQRKINTYTATIQFVELKFSGGNIENTIAKLPKKALPINSIELRNLLQTRIKMFQDINSNSDHKLLIDFKSKVELLRKKYLTPITCRPGKSIIKIENKEQFNIELRKLKNETKTLNESLTTMLEESKLNTIDLLKKELKAFFIANEPNEVKNISRTDVKERKLEDMISAIASSLKFPKISKLIENISLTALFYDLTWNDFKDEKLLHEFKEKTIMNNDDIDSIVNMKDAYETQNS